MIDSKSNSNRSRENNSGSLELGPDLPLTAFTSSRPWNPDRIRALALYCSDGRWGEAFDEFCQNHLGIPRYDRWAVPGGPAWLVPADEEAGYYKTARTQLNFLVEVHQLQEIVLITHFGCAYYADHLKLSANACIPPQMEDLRRAAKTLREWYPEMRIESFLAMRVGNSLSFHEVK